MRSHQKRPSWPGAHAAIVALLLTVQSPVQANDHQPASVEILVDTTNDTAAPLQIENPFARQAEKLEGVAWYLDDSDVAGIEIDRTTGKMTLHDARLISGEGLRFRLECSGSPRGLSAIEQTYVQSLRNAGLTEREISKSLGQTKIWNVYLRLRPVSAKTGTDHEFPAIAESAPKRLVARDGNPSADVSDSRTLHDVSPTVAAEPEVVSHTHSPARAERLARTTDGTLSRGAVAEPAPTIHEVANQYSDDTMGEAALDAIIAATTPAGVARNKEHSPARTSRDSAETAVDRASVSVESPLQALQPQSNAAGVLKLLVMLILGVGWLKAKRQLALANQCVQELDDETELLRQELHAAQDAATNHQQSECQATSPGEHLAEQPVTDNSQALVVGDIVVLHEMTMTIPVSARRIFAYATSRISTLHATVSNAEPNSPGSFRSNDKEFLQRIVATDFKEAEVELDRPCDPAGLDELVDVLELEDLSATTANPREMNSRPNSLDTDGDSDPVPRLPLSSPHTSSPHTTGGPDGEVATEDTTHAWSPAQTSGQHSATPTIPPKTKVAASPVVAQAAPTKPATDDFELEAALSRLNLLSAGSSKPAEPVLEQSSAVSSESVDNEAETVRHRLAEMFSLDDAQLSSTESQPTQVADNLASSSAPIATPPAGVDEQSDSPESPAVDCEDPQSVSEYMEKLFSRLRGKSNTTNATRTESVEQKSPPQQKPAIVEAEPVVPVPPVPRPTIDHNRERAGLDQLRQVANLSAKTAVETHHRKTQRYHMIVRGGLALVGLSAIATLGYYGYSLRSPWTAVLGITVITACLGLIRGTRRESPQEKLDVEDNQ